jgi:glycosyltransferase involved in cell wall biosynthesis
VVTIHDTVPWTHPDTLTPRGAHWHRAMAERAAVHADAVTVPTHAVGTELAERVPRLDPSRIHVLGAGVAGTLLAEPTPAMAEQVGAGLPERYLISVATLEPRKGLDVLIAALARLGDKAPPLLVVGQPGWGNVDLAEAAAAAGLPPGAVRALGRVTDDELGVILRRAAALVAPARAEGFGLPVAEAMALGTPVICSDAPALVEVADGAALVVPRGDVDALACAIADLMADDSARARLGAAGRAGAGRFDWDEVARRAWLVYRSVT